MKTEKQIKTRLYSVNVAKAIAMRKGTDETYRVNCKAEKLLKWVLGD